MAPVQNVVLVFMNVMAYAFNYWVCVYVIGAFDGTGGAVTTHVFGAFFGAACTAVASPKGAHLDPDCCGRYQSDILSLFGSLMIWAYYPSYNSFYAPPEAQQAVAINTYMALLGSSVAGCVPLPGRTVGSVGKREGEKGGRRGKQKEKEGRERKRKQRRE
eukprot:2067672-Rhodomonas_salina.1